MRICMFVASTMLLLLVVSSRSDSSGVLGDFLSDRESAELMGSGCFQYNCPQEICVQVGPAKLCATNLAEECAGWTPCTVSIGANACGMKRIGNCISVPGAGLVFSWTGGYGAGSCIGPLCL